MEIPKNEEGFPVFSRAEEGASQQGRRQSGAEIGAANLQRLKSYLEDLAASRRKLPSRNGKVNTSAVALACGFDRAVLYQNPTARRLLHEGASKLGLAPQISNHENAVPDLRDQSILRLEQENASLKAEIFDLRRKVRRLEHVEEIMVQTGKRVPL